MITSATLPPVSHLMEPDGIGYCFSSHTLPSQDGLVLELGDAGQEQGALAARVASGTAFASAQNLILYNGHAGLGANALLVAGMRPR